MNFDDYLFAGARELNILLTVKQSQQFAAYYDLLLTWNKKMNLTAITAPQEVAIKHMVDSLSCYHPAFFPENCRVIDVGTGAGFPGIPLKIIRPDIQLTLLDSLNKRLLFLQEVLKNLSLPGVELIHSRAEDAGCDAKYREKFTVVLSRAVAGLNVLSELCLPLVSMGGYFIALKGAKFEDELTAANRAIQLLGGKVTKVSELTLPGLNDLRAIIYISKIRSTSAKYPRKAGIPEKIPL